MTRLIGIGGLGQVSYQQSFVPSVATQPSQQTWPTADQATSVAIPFTYATAPSAEEETPVEEPPPEEPPERDQTKTMWIVGGILGAVVLGGAVIWMVARKKKAG